VVVQKYNPGLAAHWNSLSADVREALLADTAARLQQVDKPDGDNADRGKEDESQTAQPKPSDSALEPPALPDAISDAELTALANELGEDSPAVATLRKMAEGFNRYKDFLSHMSEVTVGALDEMGSRLYSMRQERQLEQAMVDQADDIGDVSKADFDAIAKAAGEMVTKGRVTKMDDAVALAVIEFKKSNPQEAGRNPKETGERKRKAAQAASLGKSSRRLGKPAQRRPDTIAEAWEQAKAEARE